MRKRSPLSPYNRADAMFRKAEDRPDPESFNGLKLAAINELQLFYLFVKLSGVTDGLYDNYMNPDFQPSVILDANGDHMKFGDVKKLVIV